MRQKITAALFEITNACDLNCIHCYRDKRGGGDLSLPQIKTIIEKITASGVDSLILTGGEPLLRKDFFEILDFAEDCNVTDVVINTNGLHLDDARIISGMMQHIEIISAIPVSFDGARSETHDFIRGKGQFSKLMKIVDKDSLDDFPIGINVTIGKWNFEDFEKFFDLYDDLIACDINFGIFIPLGAGKQLFDQVLSPDQCQSLIEMSEKKKKAGYEIELCSVPYSNFLAKGLSYACCKIFTEYISITAEGNVIPCVLYDFNCGSLLEMELDEILLNPIAELFRKPKKFKKQVSGYCNSCSKFKSCKGGCNLLTYALKGTLYDSDPLCPIHP